MRTRGSAQSQAPRIPRARRPAADGRAARLARAARPAIAALLAGALTIPLASACAAAPGGAGGAGTGGAITAIGAENEYASVISQVGGRYVHVDAIMSNPSTDPHTYEASPAVAREIGSARLIVQNGVGYDPWATTIINAAPDPARTVINVQQLLGLPDGTPNPHLWYDPATMPKVASAVATALAAIDPAHATAYQANAATFTASLAAWNTALASFKARYPGTPVATTEPVADYMLQAAGADNLTPWAFQADIMNGVDPAPQDVAAEKALFTGHKVKAFLYNQQVTSPLTQSFIATARASGVPVVGVYETMPTPGFDYQSWMLAEVSALARAVTDKTSTERLQATGHP
jgi:zinc/manganese transport system substrate-binding protein